MNFLAHLYLSETFDEEMVGNLMADFITGRIDDQLPPAIQRGIGLHREIDAFTDAHPVVRIAKHRLFATYRHYAAVIMDIFYDHFLAVRWSQYHPDPLEMFAAQVYELLHEKRTLLPAAMRPMTEAMQRRNWLVNYATLEGIGRALTGMTRRTSFVSGMEHATTDLQRDYDFYEENFHQFFPELIAHVAEVKTGNRF